MIGQDAVTTAQAFLDGVGFDGVVLTKLDGDARGGAALSVAKVTGRQMMFASNGEKLDDFDAFHPDRMASRILGMGDMLTLIEQAEKAFDEDQAEKMAAKFGRGDDFTLEDFMPQMEQRPQDGLDVQAARDAARAWAQMREQIDNIDDREIDRVAAIIKSMTPAERGDHKIINGSRRQRIAKGSGSTVAEVNGLVERFFEARKMMRRWPAGGVPGMPGMPGMPGHGPRQEGQGQGGRLRRRSRASRSGNPAKRARQRRQGRRRPADAGPAPTSQGSCPSARTCCRRTSSCPPTS